MASSQARRAKTSERDVQASAPRGQTLAVGLQATIEREIVEGVFGPGQKLDELVIAERFGVSRTPVREALRALAAVGLVEFSPRVGAVVARPTISEVMDLFELVAELEGLAARLAAERMTPESERTILAAHEACRLAAHSFDPEAYYSANGVFHRAIRKAAANGALDREIEQLDKRLSPYRRFITFRPGRTETALREHEGIAGAIAARDGERAAKAMRAHVHVLADDVFALVKTLKL